MRSNRQRAREELQLAIVRFRKLLEDARRLGCLVADAREKMAGDFIFDRQYIVALVDEAVALAGQLVFHAYVLAPGRTGAVDRLYDGIRGGGRALLGGPASNDAAAVAADGRDDGLEAIPEFRLLADAVSWLDGPASAGDGSVLSLVDAVFDLTAASVDVRPGLDIGIDRRIHLGEGAAGAIHVIDLGAGGRGGTAHADRAGPDDGPLNLISLGAGRTRGGAGRDSGACEWFAAIDAGHLSLFGGPRPGRVHVEAVLTGDPAGDFVFVGAIDTRDPRSFIPDAMTVRRTPRGYLAWMYGVRFRDLEDGLVRLGQGLFGGAATPG